MPLVFCTKKVSDIEAQYLNKGEFVWFLLPSYVYFKMKEARLLTMVFKAISNLRPMLRRATGQKAHLV